MSLSKNNKNQKIVSFLLPVHGEEFWSNLPLLVLIAANALPLIGVLFWEWNAFYIVLLYWAENLVIGFYNILKIAFVRVRHPMENFGKLFMIPFFMVHYGGFAAGHGLFILLLFSKGKYEPSFGEETWPCFFVFLQMFINVVKHIMQTVPGNFKIAVLGLFASHGVSFVINYLYKGEYTRTSAQALMGQPYARVFVMHIAIIAGAFLTMMLGSPAAILLVLVLLKTIIDINLHLREHKKAAKISVLKN